MNRLAVVLILAAFFLLIDVYFFQAVIAVSKNWSSFWRSFARYGFWVPTLLSILALLWWAFDDPYRYSANVRNWVITGLVATYFSKILGILVVFVDDVQRGVRYAINFFSPHSTEGLAGKAIPRSEFLAKAALLTTAVPLGGFVYGIVSGAHDYRIRKISVNLPNLPKSFDGIRIGQISDIHSGSFWNKTAVSGGVDLFLKEKPDVIFFTGDLVNNQTSEFKDYFDIFKRLKAPLGVFSITGNHDYGDYMTWPSREAKVRNLEDLFEAHRRMGYDLLLNEHRMLSQGPDKIAILGVENWGARFVKHGRLNDAWRGTEEGAVKLLLSHDPSHWDAQVRPGYPDINMMFAGHTHGFQFGVEIGNFKWSPAQYAYKQWAGLYQEGSQFLYVNRGFGYLGYPGRIGIPPELTIFELKRA